MTYFKYITMVIDLKFEKLTSGHSELKDLGNDGYELITVISVDNKLIYYFKKEEYED